MRSFDTFRYSLFVSIFLSIVLIITSCARKGPAPIYYGKDICDWCGMTISDPRFASEIVTSTGKVYKFDSIECMISFYMSKDIPDKKKAHLYVSDFMKPGKFIDARKAIYFHSGALKSPMAINVIALSNGLELKSVELEYKGEQLTWPQLKLFVLNRMNMLNIKHMNMKHMKGMHMGQK